MNKFLSTKVAFWGAIVFFVVNFLSAPRLTSSPDGQCYNALNEPPYIIIILSDFIRWFFLILLIYSIISITIVIHKIIKKLPSKKLDIIFGISAILLTLLGFVISKLIVCFL